MRTMNISATIQANRAHPLLSDENKAEMLLNGIGIKFSIHQHCVV
jgi:hypothetical protein